MMNEMHLERTEDPADETVDILPIPTDPREEHLAHVYHTIFQCPKHPKVNKNYPHLEWACPECMRKLQAMIPTIEEQIAFDHRLELCASGIGIEGTDEERRWKLTRLLTALWRKRDNNPYLAEILDKLVTETE